MPLYFVTGMDHIITQIVNSAAMHFLLFRKTIEKNQRGIAKKSQNKHFPAKRTGAAFSLSPMSVCEM